MMPFCKANRMKKIALLVVHSVQVLAGTMAGLAVWMDGNLALFAEERVIAPETPNPFPNNSLTTSTRIPAGWRHNNTPQPMQNDQPRCPLYNGRKGFPGCPFQRHE